MTYKEVIIYHLKNMATDEERLEIQTVLNQLLKDNKENELKEEISRMYTGSNKLQMIKFVKDETGWGLKDSKDWFDSNIIPFHIPIDDYWKLININPSEM